MPNSTLIKHDRAFVNGTRLHYITAGRGDLVILLHGWPQTSHEWHKVIPLLAESYTVIAPDMRGIGDSAKPADGYDRRNLAEDIYQLVKQLKYEQFFLVGHDTGMQVAYALAASYPAAVKKLVLIEALLAGLGLESVMNFSQPKALIHMALNMQRDLAESLIEGKERIYIEHILRPLAYDPASISQADVDEYVKSYSSPGGMRAGFEYYRTYFTDVEHNKEFAKTKLPMPVLAVGGDHSLGEHVKLSLAGLTEKLEGKIMSRCGHHVPDEHPVELAEMLHTFFDYKL
jgi:pimeloyl-ACP methyl ester carboxylesterase